MLPRAAGFSILALTFSVSCNLFNLNKKSLSRQAGGLRPLNVVLVTIDTLRPDRLRCYGYTQIETPTLDRLARQGTLFENAVCQAPLTAPSHASIMTGLYPTVHKVRDTGGFILSSSQLTLSAILQNHGWETAAFVGASVLKKRFGFGHGFTVYDDQMEPSSETAPQGQVAERRAGEVVDHAIRWLDSQRGKPFLLWVHLYDPHLPYDPPPPFREKYKSRLYDGEVAYTDRELGRLLEAVERKSNAENTIIAVLSDHGEAFSEHGEYAHGVFLYDVTVKILFLITGPGAPAGLRVKQQVRSVDLLPTLLEMLGGNVPPGVQGVSLVPAFSGKHLPTDCSYTETLFPKLNMGWSELRGIRTNRWMYIRAPKPELYDLVQDPGETTNVIDKYAAEAAELEAKLKKITEEDSETVKPAPVDPRTMQQLRSLGYLGGSTSKEYELTGKGTDPKDRTAIIKALYKGIYSELPVAQRIAMLRQAVVKDPGNPSLYNSLGDLYAQAGHYGELTRLYQDALAKGIRSAWLYSRLGQLYLRQRNLQKAIPYFEAAARMNPADFDSLQNLAVAYRETGRLAEAERTLTSIVNSGELYAPAYNELGMLWVQKGNQTTALRFFEQAAKLDPIFQLNLARLHRMMGNYEKARSAFQTFLGAASTRPSYRAIIPQVKEELAALP